MDVDGSTTSISLPQSQREHDYGVHLGNRPLVHGAPAASAASSSFLKSGSTSERSFSSTPPNSAATMSYCLVCVAVSGSSVLFHWLAAMPLARPRSEGGDGSLRRLIVGSPDNAICTSRS